MRLVRSFSSSTCRARQGFFQDTGPKKLSKEGKDFLIARKRADQTTNSWLPRDSKVIRSVFFCQADELNRLRSECARHIAAALAKLQDPASFEVQDLTFDKIMRVPTISYLPELALIDLRNPLGIPPDTPQSEIPPIHDPSLVAKALSEVGFSGAFLQLDRYNLNAGKQRWPIYPHIPYGGYIPPPRLHVDADSKLGGSVTLTLPGATVQPLHRYFRWFAKSNSEFQATNELVTIWARSHNISLSPQAIALMVIAAMQGEESSFTDVRLAGAWSQLEYRKDGRSKWEYTVDSVDAGFTEVPPLPLIRIPAQLMCFFRHWRDQLAKSDSFAFSVRNGRANQLIPREYIPERAYPSDFGFLISNRDYPAEDLPSWRHDRLVIQDPFLVTHNHTASLSPVAVANLEQQVIRTAIKLYSGFPLVSVYGQYAAPPGSEAEAKILADPKAYTGALGLLEPGRVPPELLRENEPVTDDSSELRTPLHRDRWNHREFSREYVPSREDSSETRTPVHRTWSKNSRRWFHASSIAPAKQNPAKNVPMTPPKPISLEGRGRKLAEDQEGWGLNSPVRKPSFWRPAHVREPLTLPTNTGSSGPLHATPVTGTGTTNSVPPARETRAGIAYKTKTVLPKPKGFHTTAYCAARRVPELPKIIGSALDPTVLQSRRQTLFMVQDAIQKAFGTNYKVELFGSTRYGISSAKSDLDMVLLDPHHPYGAAPGYEWDVGKTPVYDLRTVAKILKKAGFFIFETLPKASVPIIKFMDNRTGHRVDLNINDRLGVLNSDLIKRYCELNPVLVPMIQYVKLWAKPLGLNSPSRNHLKKPITFSSYALVMMTIGFLQHRRLLPNLQEDLPPLEPGKLKGTFWLHKPRIMCCDVRYNMAEDWTPPEDIPVEQLMQDWFNFWGHSFKFEDEMISIREGGRIPRPPRVSGAAPFNGMFWNIDPFIRSKNITGNVPRGSVHHFMLECRNYAASKEFEQGLLPRPRSYNRTEKIAGLDELVTPPEMRSATWIPVDAIPAWNHIIPNRNRDQPLPQYLSPNRPEEPSAPATPSSSMELLASHLDTRKKAKPDKKQAGKKDTGKKTKPIRTKTEWSVGEEEFPFTWHDPLEMSKPADDEVEVEVKVDVDLEVDTPKNLSETADGGAAETAEQPPRIPDPNDSTAATNNQKFDHDPTLRFDEYGRFLRPEPRPRPPPEEPEEDQVGFGLR